MWILIAVLVLAVVITAVVVTSRSRSPKRDPDWHGAHERSAREQQWSGGSHGSGGYGGGAGEGGPGAGP